MLNYTNIEKQCIMKLFKLIQNCSYCKHHFEDATHIAFQHNGLGMGKCDAPPEANLVMLFFEFNYWKKLM